MKHIYIYVRINIGVCVRIFSIRFFCSYRQRYRPSRPPTSIDLPIPLQNFFAQNTTDFKLFLIPCLFFLFLFFSFVYIGYNALIISFLFRPKKESDNTWIATRSNKLQNSIRVRRNPNFGSHPTPVWTNTRPMQSFVRVPTSFISNSQCVRKRDRKRKRERRWRMWFAIIRIINIYINIHLYHGHFLLPPKLYLPKNKP